MSEHRALNAQEVVACLKACEDKRCKDCLIGLSFGCARHLIREAERVIRVLEEQLKDSRKDGNHE